MCARVASTAGLMTLSSGCGKNPSPTISTMAGASEAISSGLRSKIFALSSRSGPVMVRWAKGELEIKAQATSSGGGGTGLLAVLGASPKATFEGARIKGGRFLIKSARIDAPNLVVTGKGERGVLGGLSFDGEMKVASLGPVRPGAKGSVIAKWTASSFAGHPWGFTVDSRAAGFATYPYKLAAFVLSAMLAGLAGFLYALKDGFVNPEILSWHQSGAVLLMIILGGLGHLRGALLGALAFTLLQELYQSEAVFGSFAKHWQLSLGLTIIAFVALLPHGLIGLLQRKGEK